MLLPIYRGFLPTSNGENKYSVVIKKQYWTPKSFMPTAKTMATEIPTVLGIIEHLMDIFACSAFISTYGTGLQILRFRKEILVMFLISIWKRCKV